MTKVRFIFKNLWRSGTILTQSTEQAQFPAINTQDDIKTLVYKSRFGLGTGNGQFVVDNTNKYIDFGEDVVVDGNLEVWGSATDLTNWTEVLAGTSTINREATEKHGGSYGARMDINSSDNGAYFYQNINLVAGNVYVLSLWYKTAAGKTAIVRLRDSASNVFLKSDGTWVTTPSTMAIVLPAATNWTKYTLQFTAHASYTAYRLTAGHLVAWGSTAASTSFYIDDISVSSVLSATITPATYNGQTLVVEIKTRMDAAGGTYTPSYSESTGKFTILGAANFALYWLIGTNTANNAAGLLGFSKAADDSDAATYTGDYVSIHTSETIDCDFGSAYEYDFIALLNHNLTTSAVITVYGADDSAFTSNVIHDHLTVNANNLYEFLPATRTKRYCRFEIIDPTNPSMCIQVGGIVVGKYFEPNRSFGAYNEGENDETEMEYSPSMNLFMVQERPKLITWSLPFKGLNTISVANIRLMLANNGVNKALVMCFDTTTPNGNSYWVHFTELNKPECSQIGYWIWEAGLEEVL